MANNNDDDDSVDGLSLPIFGISSIVEERRIKHEQNLHSFAHGLFARLELIKEITLAVDRGEDTVSIEFPVDLIVSVNKMFIGKITYADVWSCFSNLLDLEQINFQFKSSILGGCCFEPRNAWADYKDSSPEEAANSSGYALCHYCDRHLMKDAGWLPSYEGEYCCSDFDDCYNKSLSENPPCWNCEKEFNNIPEDGELAMLGLEIEIS